jgi:serine/threonine protein kinase
VVQSEAVSARGEIAADPFLGHIVDERFRVEALLGAGTVGSVYRAHDSAHDRTVALKIWNGSAHDDQTRGRFMRELKALSTLRHPNIVDLQGYGMCDALPYVAMEYLDGQTLDALLANGQPLDTTLVFEVMTQVLQALAYAHELGVVHRDLKPDNVVLVTGARGQPLVKLLDYGLAKFLSPDDDPVQDSALTMTGMIMGTPLYMAPEQAAGKSVDARADVYTAGCLLFEMLSGNPPYSAESNAELIRMHLMAEIPKLADARRDVIVTEELQEWLERALAKRPEERFAHAREMLTALSSLPRPALMSPSSAAALAELIGVTRRDRMPLIAALITGFCTAALLAYALLR